MCHVCVEDFTSNPELFDGFDVANRKPSFLRPKSELYLPCVCSKSRIPLNLSSMTLGSISADRTEEEEVQDDLVSEMLVRLFLSGFSWMIMLSSSFRLLARSVIFIEYLSEFSDNKATSKSRPGLTEATFCAVDSK